MWGLSLLIAGCGSTTPPVRAPVPAPDLDALFEPYAIRNAMASAAEAHLAPVVAPRPGELQLGLVALADLSDDPRYLAAARASGERRRWRLRDDDDLSVAQAFLTVFQHERDRSVIGPVLATLDEVAARTDQPLPAAEALFATPPALAMATTATGERRFADAACAIWWRTTDALYDRAESLYRHDARASKAFSARDNALALAGLARVLENLPDDHAERPRLTALYRAMADKLARLQRGDGTWRVRLLEADAAPDARATALGAYALAWGIDHALLDRGAYEPAVRRAWAALRPSATASDARAAGDLLLAGSELYRVALFAGSRATTVVAHNPLDEGRADETLELEWPRIAASIGFVTGDPIVVVDERSGALLPWQVYDGDDDGVAETLLVSQSFVASDTRRVSVRRLARPFRAPAPRARAYGRFFPEVRDDFAWENDKIAFRTWGPANEAAGGISSGIDVLAKRVRAPVIEGWYRRRDFTRDYGEGLDFYQVGPSRGCGGLGLWQGDRLYVSRNFRQYKQLAAGPVRVAFELGYDPWGPEGVRVGETKRISLDIGGNLSRIESRFALAGPPRPLPLAVGVVRREPEGHVARDVPPSWLSYWQPAEGPSGEIGCGVVLPVEGARYLEEAGHFLLVVDHPSDRPFVYYAGGCWSHGLDFRSPDDWAVYLASFSRRLSAPIVVSTPDAP